MNFLQIFEKKNFSFRLTIKAFFLLGFLLCSAFASARPVRELCPAPELYTILPHSAFMLEPVTGQAKEELLSKASADCRRIAQAYGIDPEKSQHLFRAYTQTVGSHTFYRIILSRINLEDLTPCPVSDGDYTESEYNRIRHGDNFFVQILFYRTQAQDVYYPVYLAAAPYGTWSWNKDEGLWTLSYSDFLLKSLDREVGLLYTQANLVIENALTQDGKFHLRIKKQLGRPSAQNTALYSIVAFAKASSGSKPDLPFVDNNYFAKINGSDFLFTPASPLANSLISLFDSNKETYFVENAPSRPLWLNIQFNADKGFLRRFGELRVTQAFCINGASESEPVYMQNKRLASFSVSASSSDGKVQTCTANMRDYRMDGQTLYLPFKGGFDTYEFVTSDIYNQSKNTNCIVSEFNLNLKGMGWLFGKPDTVSQ